MRNRLFLLPRFAAVCDFHGAWILKSAVLYAAVLLLFVQPSSRAESASDSVSRPVTSSVSRPETSELFFETYIADDVFKFSGGEITSMIYYGGVEYDQHSLGNNANRFGRIWNWPATLVLAPLPHPPRASTKTRTLLWMVGLAWPLSLKLELYWIEQNDPKDELMSLRSGPTA